MKFITEQINDVSRKLMIEGKNLNLTPGKRRESTISNLAPKCRASAFVKVSWYISEPVSIQVINNQCQVNKSDGKKEIRLQFKEEKLCQPAGPDKRIRGLEIGRSEACFTNLSHFK